MTRKINTAGLDLIEDTEGCRLRAYPDPGTGGAPWTIGYGHTGPEVTPTSSISYEQAQDYLDQDIRRFEEGVDKLAPSTTDNQFSALVCFAFNVGLGNLKTSTLLKKHNAGDFKGAQAEFSKWDKANGRVISGLERRRNAEAALYGKA